MEETSEYRWAAADPSKIDQYATELVALKPDVILVNGTRGTRQGTGQVTMADETEPRNNSVERSYDGAFHALWRGRVVYANGRVKRFKTEQEAWEFLARCDALGKIEH